MRHGLFALPIPLFVLLAYNAVVLLSPDPAVTLPAVLLRAALASGAAFTLTTGEGLILLGVAALFLASPENRRNSVRWCSLSLFDDTNTLINLCS